MKISHEDIRIFLQDKVEKNFLLDNLEFNDEQVAKAIEYTVDLFNETAPMVNKYTYELFPYKYCLLIGVSSWLLKSAAIQRTRNRIAFSSDGIQVDDQAMADQYLAMGTNLQQEFMAKIKEVKIEENIRAGFCLVTSEYSWLGPYRYRKTAL